MADRCSRVGWGGCGAGHALDAVDTDRGISTGASRPRCRCVGRGCWIRGGPGHPRGWCAARAVVVDLGVRRVDRRRSGSGRVGMQYRGVPPAGASTGRLGGRCDRSCGSRGDRLRCDRGSGPWLVGFARRHQHCGGLVRSCGVRRRRTTFLGTATRCPVVRPPWFRCRRAVCLYPISGDLRGVLAVGAVSAVDSRLWTAHRRVGVDPYGRAAHRDLGDCTLAVEHCWAAGDDHCRSAHHRGGTGDGEQTDRRCDLP